MTYLHPNGQTLQLDCYLWLQVAVHNASAVHEADSLDQFPHELACLCLCEEFLLP